MMEYNNYYPVHSGQPSPPPNMMGTQPDCSTMGGQIMTPNGPTMMQPSPAPSTPHSMRQTPGPPPMQTQQLMGPGPQMHQQPSPHPIYHQLPQHPPISHSASPHPSSTPHAQQPPPRPSTGPSPLHQQSPIHMNGPSPKLHSVGPLGPPSQPQTPGVVGPPPPPMHGQAMPGVGSMNHHPTHNFVGSPMPHHSSPHYGHSPMNSHQQNPPPPQMHHHGGPPIPQPGPPPQHPANMGGRGPQALGSMPLHPPPPPGYMMSPHPPPPPPMHHHQHHHPVGGIQPPHERGSPFYQQIPQTEFRIIELNKRLQSRPRPLGPPRTLPIDELDESRWWKQFACDFFDDEATLTLRIPGEDKPTEYTIGRTLIPRFFKSYFDGGVTDFSIKLRNIRETTHHPGFITLDCDQTDITTKNFFRYHGSNPPLSVVVHTEGHLSVDFISNSFDNLLIKSWRFYANQCHEYVDRSMTTVGMANPYLAEPVTRFGLTKNTFSFLKMCMIMEPMQDLMIHHRQTHMDPRTCLKHLLYDRYKHKNVDDNPTQPPKRRRKARNTATSAKNRRTTSNGANAIGGNPVGTSNNMMQLGDVGGGLVPNLPLASQDVLVVGEPSMLGADFGDENERRITRLENNQFDPTTSMDAIRDNNNHIISQQMSDSTSGQQIESNHMSQNNNHINQLQQQQHHQATSVNNNNDPLNLPDQQQPQQQNSIQNHSSYQEQDAEGHVASIMNYNPNAGDQSEGIMREQCNSDEPHSINETNLGTPNHGQDLQQAASNNCNNNNNNNNNNPMNSFLMNNNDTHLAKSEVDIKQQQQHQPMTATCPAPVRGPEGAS